MSYTPPLHSGEISIRSCSNLRARLNAGGSAFRVREAGQAGNLITAEVIVEDDLGYLVITNHHIVIPENVVGKTNTKFLNLTGTYQDLYILDQLHTTTIHAQYYSISVRIRNAIQESLPYVLPSGEDLGKFAFDKMFSAKSKLSVLLTKKTENFSSIDTISIAPRVKIYTLSKAIKNPIDESTGLPGADVEGWSIEDLRSKLSSDPWIEMPARGSDMQVEGEDTLFLTPFSQTSFTGGNGLPLTPSAERTGPSKSLIHVNYGEQSDGSLSELNQMYVWEGESSTIGRWENY